MAMKMFLYMSADNMKATSDPAAYGSPSSTFPGAIEVASFSHGIKAVVEEQGGRPRSVVDVHHGNAVIGRDSDSRTPQLIKMISEGEFISEANVFFWNEGQPKPFLIYNMTFVHIVSFRLDSPTRYPSGESNGHFAGQWFPAEEIELCYGQLRTIYREEFAGQPVRPAGTNPTAASETTHSNVMQIPVAWTVGLSSAGTAKNDDKP